MSRVITSKSGHTGVSWSKSAQKWQAYICVKKKMTHLGYFDDLGAAVLAREAAEQELGRKRTRHSYDAKTQAWIDEAATKEERRKRQQRAKYLRNGHKYRARIKRQYDADPDKVRSRNAEWRKQNPEKTSAAKLAWERKFKEENPEKWSAQRHEIYMRRREKVRAYGEKWRKKNPHLNAKKQAAYKFRKMKATPPWANDFFIEEAYELAALRNKSTGIEWEVDHIMPLCGRDVCGLHVETNLQVIPKYENRRKHARGWKKYIPQDLIWT